MSLRAGLETHQSALSGRAGARGKGVRIAGVERQASLFYEIRKFVLDRQTEERVTFACDRRIYVAGVYVLRRVLGEEWSRERLFANQDPYLAEHTGDGADFKFQDRVVSLAELLLSLYGLDGFSSRIDLLRSANLETAVAELDGVGMFVRSGVPVRFVEPGGGLGNDYDAEAVAQGQRIACEMKAKVEGTVPSSSSLRDTVARARKQLPLERPGVVFVKVPEIWGTTSDGRKAIVDGVKERLDPNREDFGCQTI